MLKSLCENVRIVGTAYSLFRGSRLCCLPNHSTKGVGGYPGYPKSRRAERGEEKSEKSCRRQGRNRNHSQNETLDQLREISRVANSLLVVAAAEFLPAFSRLSRLQFFSLSLCLTLSPAQPEKLSAGNIPRKILNSCLSQPRISPTVIRN